MSDFTQLRRLGLFDARAPRYTSYPTAPFFSADVTPAQTRDWLRAVRPGEQVSLYVHVPFCRRLCWFCACRTQGTTRDEPVKAYVDTLLTELARVSALLPGGVTLSRLHWGGGTPTMLPPDQTLGLARTIASLLPFAEGAEFSVEIDPNEIDGPRLDALAAAGLTRASVGVQDFDPRIQAAIGRRQSFAVTEAAVRGLRARGVESLNLDILFGLPFQTVTGIRQTVSQVLELAPDRVALYGYAHVPWMARRQQMIPAEALPEPEQRLELYSAAEEMFLAAGYRGIGIDHFALPGDGLARASDDGTLRRNFQGYTDDRAATLIGIGASSISRYRQGYAQNAPATSAYQAAVRGGGLATTRGHVFSADDVVRGRVIEALMCDFSVDFSAVAASTGCDTDALRCLAETLDDAFPGATRVVGTRLDILPGARPLTRMIAQRFDAYAARPAGYSQAI